MDFAITYDATNFNDSNNTSAPDITKPSQATNDVKVYYKLSSSSTWILPDLASWAGETWTQSHGAGSLGSLYVGPSDNTSGSVTNVVLYNVTLAASDLALQVLAIPPPSPIYTRTTTAGTGTTIAANTYGAWNGWNPTKDWSMVITFTTNISSSSSYAVPFAWILTGFKVEFEMHQSQIKVNWETNTSLNQERMQVKIGTLTNGTIYSLAVTYDSTAYNAGPGSIPNLSNGDQLSNSSMKFYLKAADQGSGTYALPSLSQVSDNWDNSHTRTFPPGDGSTEISCPGSNTYAGGSTPVSYVAFYNATISEAQINSDH